MRLDLVLHAVEAGQLHHIADKQRFVIDNFYLVGQGRTGAQAAQRLHLHGGERVS